MKQYHFDRESARVPFTIGIFVLAIVIFAIDAETPLEVSVSILYVFVVLLASFSYGRGGVMLAGLGCVVLTVTAHALSPGNPWEHWPLFDRAVNVVGIAMATLLVMRGRAATDALRESEAYLTEAQQLSHTGSIGWRDPYAEQFWSRETYQIYQYEPDAAKPTLAMMIARTHPDDRMPLEQAVDKAYRDAAGFELEHRLSMPDGTTRFVQLVTRAEEQGGRVSFVGAVMDVTAARRATDELQRVHSDLARVSRATTMGQLAASIAHEINQPLTGVVTNSHTVLHWLGERTLNLDKARVTAERVLRDGERASGVIRRIQGLLTKTPPQTKDIDVNDLIREVVDLLQTELRLRDVAVHTELAENLPRFPGDSIQLQQVLLNLVINGADAMSDLTGRPRQVIVGSRLAADGDVLIWVRDYGVGLDRDVADKIFDPFFTTKAKGMGMGLAICRSIVEAHGGRLSASSAEPHGALFEFTLPGKAADDA